MILGIIPLIDTQTYMEAASRWNNMPSNQYLAQKKNTRVIVFEPVCFILLLSAK